MKIEKMYGKENHSFDANEEAKLLLNQEVRVTFARSEMFGNTGIVEAIMADGRTLDIKMSDGKNAFLDVTFVGEIQERTQFAKTAQSLGPDANSVLPQNRL
tara:strand:+ start:1463 stop:1765 length:303 start_codon:yes stop_codon:yes gene_type:complete